MSQNENIPAGRYDGWALPHNIDPDASEDAPPPPIELPITADKEGFAQVCIKLAVAVKGQEEGQEEAFASAEIYQTIDPRAPVRGNTDTTPFEFGVLCLLALGAESREAINAALGEAFATGRLSVVIPGLGAPGTKADVKVDYKPNKRGGEPFMNVQVFARRDVSKDAASELAKLFAGKGPTGGAPAAPPPFAALPNRGTPVRPPQPAKPAA